MLPFFDGCGPFKRWLPPAEKVTVEDMRQGLSTNDMAPEVEYLIRETVRKVRANGGRVVGLIGFSQGTKVVAGLLRASEVRRELKLDDKATDWCDFDFGVSVCGSYPPPLFPRSIFGQLSAEQLDRVKEGKITSPTFHVLGNQDEWKWAGQGLISKHYEKGEEKSVVVEWEMGHFYPVLQEESERIAEWVQGVCKVLEQKRAER